MASSRHPVAPPEIAELVACMGDDNVLKLLELRGGTRLHVPQPCNVHSSWMAQHFDEVSLMRLAGAFGGCTIMLPLCREWRARIYLAQGGRSHAEIALKVAGTVNWVQKLAGTDWKPQPRAHAALPGRAPEARQTGFDF